MDVRPLHNEQDYEWAFHEIERYFDEQPAMGSEEGNRFEVLSSLIHEYEEKNFKMPHVDPVDILHFGIESVDRTQSDLAELIGRNRASEILNRVRPLTLEMIRSISEAWNIPIELLAAPYDMRQHA